MLGLRLEDVVLSVEKFAASGNSSFFQVRIAEL